MTRFILTIVLGGMITYGIANIFPKSTVNQVTQNSVDFFVTSRTQMIANSMADILLMRISDDPTYRETRATKDLLGGFLRMKALSKLQSLQNLKMLRTSLLDIQRNQAKEKS